MDVESGQFPGYRDVVEIGRGGMGVVYKARDITNGHVVVLKTMIGGEESQFKRFRREVEALAQLKHRNIVSIKTVGQIKSDHYFTMEYVEGETLRDRILASRNSGGPPDH
ncbi:MAG: protein kinase, partial [Planctomycetota bacterium]|nr:protein kinase [Planctomycetota bacterium]